MGLWKARLDVTRRGELFSERIIGSEIRSSPQRGRSGVEVEMLRLRSDDSLRDRYCYAQHDSGRGDGRRASLLDDAGLKSIKPLLLLVGQS